MSAVGTAQDSGLIANLQEKVGALERELAAERAARKKEKDILVQKLMYETGRHVYYKRMVNELRRANEAGTVQRVRAVLDQLSYMVLCSFSSTNSKVVSCLSHFCLTSLEKSCRRSRGVSFKGHTLF